MTQMSLREASPALKCRAFHLTLGGATEVWYSRLLPLTIGIWPNLKKTFLNQYLSRREGEAPVQRLQDMRQALGEMLKSYLARFTDEITYCEQVTNRETLSALKGSLNMNTLFWRDVRSKNPTTYDELVKMMRVEIVSEEMIDYQNRAVRRLPSPQRQALASATLNVVPELAYENFPGEAGPSGGTDSNKKKKKKRSNMPLEGARFCSFHQLYGHDTNECRDIPRRSDRNDPYPSRKNKYPHRSAPPPPNRVERRHREHSPRRRESRD
ncbi:uncharacterized protein LOC111395050 [Olea europaea var. sylvestris]|uniref:uncharacterized protein LOC111395050 n=1 Tax=Olea europaea var. sylvestris TaxID=158386 RepID=UPI000C1CFFD2|nr:uncharacterized protein LOC111395050 [Olea europaea var. sylvestris]